MADDLAASAGPRHAMEMRLLLLAPLLLAAPAAAREAPSPARLKATVEQLVSLRHAPYPVVDDRSAARHRCRAQLGRGRVRGDRPRLRRLHHRRADRAHASPARARRTASIVEDVLGIQTGHATRSRVVIVGAHIDSRVTDVMNATADAPGANDDASGVALVLEAARILSKEKFDATIVYAVLLGRGAGAVGRQPCSPRPRRSGAGTSRRCSTTTSSATRSARTACASRDRVRVFSEGIRASEELAAQISAPRRRRRG